MHEPPDLDSAAFIAAFDEAPLWSARFGALLLRHLEIRPGLDILDLGCGTGFPLFELAHLHGPGSRLTGIDTWKAALARARDKRTAYALDHVQLIEADAAQLPFADASFDLIVSNLGLNNFAEADRVAAECARVARPGARVVLTTNPRGLMHEVYAALRTILRDPADQARLEAHEAHRGTPASIGALLERAGFRVTRTFEDSFAFRFASGAALLRHHLVRVGFLPAWRGLVEPARQADLVAALEQQLDALALVHGGVTATVPMLYLEATRP